MINKIKITLQSIYGTIHSNLKSKTWKRRLNINFKKIFAFEDGEGEMR